MLYMLLVWIVKHRFKNKNEEKNKLKNIFKNYTSSTSLVQYTSNVEITVCCCHFQIQSLSDSLGYSSMDWLNSALIASLIAFSTFLKYRKLIFIMVYNFPMFVTHI